MYTLREHILRTTIDMNFTVDINSEAYRLNYTLKSDASWLLKWKLLKVLHLCLNAVCLLTNFSLMFQWIIFLLLCLLILFPDICNSVLCCNCICICKVPCQKDRPAGVCTKPGPRPMGHPIGHPDGPPYGLPPEKQKIKNIYQNIKIKIKNKW